MITDTVPIVAKSPIVVMVSSKLKDISLVEVYKFWTMNNVMTEIRSMVMDVLIVG